MDDETIDRAARAAWLATQDPRYHHETVWPSWVVEGTREKYRAIAAAARLTPTVDAATGGCASCGFPVLRLTGPGFGANDWALRMSGIETAARRLLDAVGPTIPPGLPEPVVAALVELQGACAKGHGR